MAANASHSREPFPTPSEADGRQAMLEHLLDRAAAARSSYGPRVDGESMVRMLDDRRVVRYPTGLRFDTNGLRAGEFAFPMPLDVDDPARGFCMVVHPCLRDRPDLWVLAIAYYIPSINYGDIVTPEECEEFGAALLGLGREMYYQALCSMADLIALPPS